MWSGANGVSLIGSALAVGEQQRGAARLDGEGNSLRGRHQAVAVDRLGVVPGLAALGGQSPCRLAHNTNCSRRKDEVLLRIALRSPEVVIEAVGCVGLAGLGEEL